MLLKDKIEFYKVCFDSMQVGILVCNKSQEIVLANSPITQFFGYSTTELSKIKSADLFKNKQVFDDFISLKDKDLSYVIEGIGQKKDGGEFPLELIFSTINYEDKTYYKALITDISIRKQKEGEIVDINEQLEEEVKAQHKELKRVIDQLKKSLQKEKELNHLKTKFIALASHEFKTPLSAILTSSELLIKYADLNEDNKRNEHAFKIKSMIYHLNGMIDDLLTLENIELGEIHPNYTYFKFKDLVKRILRNTKPFLKKNQRLTFIDNTVGLTYHDSKIIQIILDNIINNAVKYSSENGEIIVKICCTDTQILFSVEDLGIGIPKDEQEFIFNRFFRAKNAMYYPGTGIGLNIVKGYVLSLNGQISFKSEKDNFTIFNVSLPKIKTHEKENIIN